MPADRLCDSGATQLTCGPSTGCQRRREVPHVTRCRRASGRAHIARSQHPPLASALTSPQSSAIPYQHRGLVQAKRPTKRKRKSSQRNDPRHTKQRAGCKERKKITKTHKKNKRKKQKYY